MTDFEALIKVPVAPLKAKIIHDLNVVEEERKQIELADALSIHEQTRFRDLVLEFDRLRRDLRYLRNRIEYGIGRFTPYWEHEEFYNPHFLYFYSSLIAIQNRHDKKYLDKLRKILAACEISPDGFIYLHDMKVMADVGNLEIHPNIMQIGAEEVPLRQKHNEYLERKIEELKKEIENLPEPPEPKVVEYAPTEDTSRSGLIPLGFAGAAIILAIALFFLW